MKETEDMVCASFKDNGVADRSQPLLLNVLLRTGVRGRCYANAGAADGLNEDTVLCRTEDGEAVAVQNRCPYRSFPLHKVLM